MRVTVTVSMNIDTDRWAEIYDTTKMVASEVKEDIVAHFEDIVLDSAYDDGLLLPDKSQEELRILRSARESARKQNPDHSTAGLDSAIKKRREAGR